MMAEMGKMMKGMGTPPAKELYPSLMELPDLPPEKRGEVERQAHGRMEEGLGLLSMGLQQLQAPRPMTTTSRCKMPPPK